MVLSGSNVKRKWRDRAQKYNRISLSYFSIFSLSYLGCNDTSCDNSLEGEIGVFTFVWVVFFPINAHSLTKGACRFLIDGGVNLKFVETFESSPC